MNELYPGVPLRYPERHRWGHNNGFRQLWLANARAASDVIVAAQRGDEKRVLDFASTLAGVESPTALARDLMRQAREFSGPLRPYKVVRDGRGAMVCTLHLGWRYKGRHQVASIEYRPMFGCYPRR